MKLRCVIDVEIELDEGDESVLTERDFAAVIEAELVDIQAHLHEGWTFGPDEFDRWTITRWNPVTHIVEPVRAS